MVVKVLMVNAADISKYYQVVFPHLGLGYLASFTRERLGNRVVFKAIDRNIEEEIREFGPDIMALTSVSQNYKRAVQYARLAKQYDKAVVVGGMHISALPSTMTENMDVAVLDEGEETFVELLRIFEAGHSFEIDKLKGINGIAYWENSKVVSTPKRELIPALDILPFPDRSIFPLQTSKLRRTAHMFTSRGCPYKCSFCASTRFWNRTRFFSAEYVVSEMRWLVEKYGIKHIVLLDDLFVADRKRLVKITELLGKEGLLGKVNFSCQARSNLVDDGLAEILKQIGMIEVSIGMESAVPSVLSYLKGDNITVEDHKRAADTLYRHGIAVHANFVIGSPQETREDILADVRFIKACGKAIDIIDINVLVPYPGTPLWEYALKRGLVSESMDWDRLSILSFGTDYKKAIILSETLSREEIYELYRMFRKEQVKMATANDMRNFPETMLSVLRHPIYAIRAVKQRIEDSVVNG